MLDVPVDAVSLSEAMDYVAQLLRGRKQGVILAVNPEKVMRAREDAGLAQLLRGAELLIADGVGVVWAIRLLYRLRSSRIAGIDLMDHICRKAAVEGHRVFCFGSSAENIQRAVASIQRRHHGIQVVGYSDGYVDAQQFSELVDRVNSSQADILFVGLGSPRQEEWIAQHRHQLNVCVLQGVGGTFDVLAGTVTRAPSVFRAFNLEWLFRLAMQPSRWRRQLALPRYARAVLWSKVLQVRRSRAVAPR